MIRLNIDTNISLGEIAKLPQRATRTPHIGNECLHGFVHEQLSREKNETAGIVNIYYDRTTQKDIYHHPSYIIVGGNKIKIAPTKMGDNDILSTHLDISCHMFRLELIFPNKNRYTYSSFMRDNMVFFERMIASVGEEVYNMGLWKRYVDSSGVIFYKTPSSWNEVKSEIFQINNPKKGWIMPNILNILAIAYIDSVVYGSDINYQISGAEMYRYAGSMLDELNMLWDLLIKDYNDCSSNMEIRMFPTGNARFASFTRAQYFRMELLFDTWNQMKKFDFEKANYYKSGKLSDMDTNYYKQKGRDIENYFQDLCFENRGILYSMADANFTSQYDMEIGQKLLIHPFCIEAKIYELDKMVNIVRDRIKRREKRIMKGVNS